MPRNSQAHGGGITCPVCRNRTNEVKDSRPSNNGSAIRRRRVCSVCQHRFTTHETVKRDVPVLVFPNGVAVEIDMATLGDRVAKGIGERVGDAINDHLWSLMREAAVKPE